MPTYDSSTALLVVDVQNDFAVPRGSLYVRGGTAVVRRANQEIARASAAGAGIFYTQDWHPPSTPHFAKDGGTWPEHCVAETWGAELHARLRVLGPVVRKGSNGEDSYSGFTMRDLQSGRTRPTELEGLLRARSIRRVVVAGLATDYCVKETAIDAARLGFETHVILAAVRAVNLQPGDGQRAIAAMRAAGANVE
jgi:nicotinamidase/pyrazinamidase